MPIQQWAVGQEVLAADFNTYLQNQVVPAFTNTTQRDSQWTAPPNGALCTTIDTNALWQRIAGVWWKPFARQAFVQRTTDSSNVATEQVVLTTPAITVPSGRAIRVSAYCRGIITTSAYANVKIREGTTTAGTQVADTTYNMTLSGPQVSSAPMGALDAIYSTSISGARQWSLTLIGEGTNTARMTALATSPIWMAVYDEGAL